MLFPLNVRRVIFVDSDQVVRADLKELMDLDMKVRFVCVCHGVGGCCLCVCVGGGEVGGGGVLVLQWVGFWT